MATIASLLAGGAILRWAISGEAAGVDSDTAGMAVMVAGLIGAFAAVLLWPGRGGDDRRAADSRHRHLRG
jgi:hypothetical protein